MLWKRHFHFRLFVVDGYTFSVVCKDGLHANYLDSIE